MNFSEMPYTWGLCPQTPEVYRFGFPAGVAALSAAGKRNLCEKRSDDKTSLPLIKSHEPLGSLLSVALSCVMGKSNIIVRKMQTAVNHIETVGFLVMPFITACLDDGIRQ